uniref:Uncharacterized protein n=1 Tax=Odontella aurita TaxID=265563 RepID=A0A7S4IXA0_9STRA|mmetsp:Transcript_3159/g.8237  ORF Transcript_3159/g.8237 Transcript_3159/m.8237 type:complete len:123 (+) Transcript_3159:138-506(+)
MLAIDPVDIVRSFLENGEFVSPIERREFFNGPGSPAKATERGASSAANGEPTAAAFLLAGGRNVRLWVRDLRPVSVGKKSLRRTDEMAFRQAWAVGEVPSVSAETSMTASSKFGPARAFHLQ